MERLVYPKSLRKLIFLVLMLSIRFVAIAEIAVRDLDGHVAGAEAILIGIVKEGRNGNFILVVETSLKGTAKPNEEIIVDENSGLAWSHSSGVGPTMPTNSADFIRQIKQADWYEKRAVFLGSMKEGKWVSYCYDWSIWTSGESTYRRNDAPNGTPKALSLEALVEVIRSTIADSTPTHQVNNASRDANAEQPPVAQNPLSPVVRSAESMKADEAKGTASAPSEERDSRIPWNIIVIAAMAALGLLGFLLKRRS